MWRKYLEMGSEIQPNNELLLKNLMEEIKKFEIISKVIKDI